MSTSRKRQIKRDLSAFDIPREDWSKFLETFRRRHRGSLLLRELARGDREPNAKGPKAPSRIKTALGVIVMLVAFTASAEAQQVSWQNPSLKVDVDLALVTATVTDPSGRIVTGLGPENFRLWEDKVEQKIEYFSEEELPLSVGLVFDVSGSMIDKLSNARDAAATFLRMGSSQDEYFLVEFSDSPKVTQGLTRNITRLQNHLVFARAKGLTSLFDAVYIGLEKVARSTNPKKALLLITDGEDNHSRYRFSEVKEFAREQDVQIFAIGIGDPRSPVLGELGNGRDVIENLAAITGGRAFFPKSVYQLEDICASIGIELKSQYVMGYRPTNTEKNGKCRKIHVKVDPPKKWSVLNVRSKTGYYGPTVDVLP